MKYLRQLQVQVQVQVQVKVRVQVRVQVRVLAQKLEVEQEQEQEEVPRLGWVLALILVPALQLLHVQARVLAAGVEQG
jgi:hypothetical protein